MHTIRKTAFFLLLPLLFSCYHINKLEVVRPEHLLSEEEMASILTEVQIAEGALIYRRTHRIEQQGFREVAYQKIFSAYGITAKILNENINYYNNDPEKMEAIYEEVLAKLSRMQSELEEEGSAADSVKTKH